MQNQNTLPFGLGGYLWKLLLKILFETLTFGCPFGTFDIANEVASCRW
jgi:hypothetical protein